MCVWTEDCTGDWSTSQRLSLLTGGQELAWKTFTNDMRMNKGLLLGTGLCMEDCHYWRENAQNTSTVEWRTHGRLPQLVPGRLDGATGRFCILDQQDVAVKRKFVHLWRFVWFCEWSHFILMLQFSITGLRDLVSLDCMTLYHWIAWPYITGLFKLLSLGCMDFYHWIAVGSF